VSGARSFVVFGSGSPELLAATLERIGSPEPLIVVSEFAPPRGEWVPFHVRRRLTENRQLFEARLAGREIAGGAILLDPAHPHPDLRALGEQMLGRAAQYFDASGPTSLARHRWRQRRHALRAAAAKAMRLLRPGEARLSLLYRAALRRGRALAAARPEAPLRPLPEARPEGISVVIPSRNGRALLARCLPRITGAQEIIVVDNGSTDGTAEWLAQAFPDVLVERDAAPLAFATAMNRGIRRARYSHVCALNNDMEVEAGFLAALRACFDAVPELFCASAQIFLPEGRRRQETGKTVLAADPGVLDLPLRCDVPLEGEDLSYVLYGSGGCSLYDARKLAALGGFDESYTPAYVEDLDLCVRAWSRGWPSVYCAGARALHHHRATTARYFTARQLDTALESNYVRFLGRAVASPERFTRMWRHAVLRLKALGKAEPLAVAATLPCTPVLRGEDTFFDLTNGETAVFPGRRPAGRPAVLVASPYLPFPLAHGAAVRIFNLLREGSRDFDFVLVSFVEAPQPVAPELLELCVEVVTVLRTGSHALPSRGRPDTVEEFDTAAFHAALRQTARKWRPALAQLEFTQLAIYAPDCRPARTILVEHDITYDLYAQLLARPETADWETRRQYELWRAFETAAWQQVDRVVTMSAQDRSTVGERAVVVGNGVDLERFQPASDPPEPRRLFFVGSFAHHPNVSALRFFLAEVFPRLRGVTLHVIAGRDHRRYWDPRHPGVEVEGFVADVRPAYRRATLVIAPLVASAGTNVKILEALAMGKVVVSTAAGIHGLDLAPESGVIVANEPARMAAEIERLLEHPEERQALERQARRTAEQHYGWGAMAAAQRRLYQELLQLPREDGVI
jgi:GT2 family glycosyltransferase/glycosyltransferase involved in cell wall biosynthesis